MRFFTRQLQSEADAVFLGSDDDAGFENRCEDSIRNSSEISLHYRKYLRQHDAQLTNSLRELATCSLHDSIITKVLRRGINVEIMLDTRGTIFLKFPSASLIFIDVQEAYGIDNIVGQVILDEELHFHEDGSFEFSVLCNRTEFGIRFNDFKLQMHAKFFASA